MKPLFPIEQINNYKAKDKVPFECENCNKVFYRAVRLVRTKINRPKDQKQPTDFINFCSRKCLALNQTKINSIITNCKQCNTQIKVINSAIKKSKTGNFFCSQSCAATYNNMHKKHGTRRSKLEFWIEMKLECDFPNLKVLYNDRETTGLELDIYFPDLKLAVELNGIFHYEPIYGEEQLEKIQNREKRKFQTCLEQNIELLIIDISSLSYFKPEKADVFYKIIKNVLIDKCKPTTKATYPDFKKFITIRKQQYLLTSYKNNYDSCPICDSEKLKKNKTCSHKCLKIKNKDINRDKFDWNSINLEEELKHSSYSQIAKKLGCSKVSIHNRAKKLKLI